eukprot:TRINITY_DN18697_c0_g1_i2.p1 TRINITY_DN18697_c0_g1~~TRINITY_DN18697_c0_g1_i2.p1  ORF type:complete len:281 (-),score=37.30 TRINITY_DN18697_c0_g1_i2:30-833(-)
MASVSVLQSSALSSTSSSTSSLESALSMRGHALRLWFFDYGANSFDRAVEYEPPSVEAVRGYEEASLLLRSKGKDTGDLPGLAYFHIPLPEYAGLDTVCGQNRLFEAALLAGKVPKPWRYVPWFVRGIGRHRVVGSSKVNTGLFNAFKRNGNVRAVFCGHDHMSDAVFYRSGIYLAYGRYGSYTPPNDWENKIRAVALEPGARVVSCNFNQNECSEFETWIETRAGLEKNSHLLVSARDRGDREAEDAGACFGWIRRSLRLMKRKYQ